MKKKVIIDCDPGIDDSIALMLALQSDELDILGITTVSGNVVSEQGAINALKVLKIMNRLDIPVFIGESDPLKRELITAQDTHGDDGLGETLYQTDDNSLLADEGVDFLLNTLNNYEPDTISLIALGPLTNLAKAIKKDSTSFNRVKEILSMGGAYRIHGNCSPVAEFNYWVDPDAADFVVKNNNKPFYLFPLDVTRKIVLSPNLREILRQIPDKKAKFIYDITRFYVDFHWQQERTLGCVINDPLVIAWFLKPELCSGFSSYMEIIKDGRAIGQSMIDSENFYQNKPNAHIMTEVNPTGFMQLLFTRLFPSYDIKIEDYM